MLWEFDDLTNQVSTTKWNKNNVLILLPRLKYINDDKQAFIQTGYYVSSDKLCSSWTHSKSCTHTHPLFKSQRSCLRALYLLSRMALLIDEIPTQLQGHNIAFLSWLGEKLASFFFPCFFSPLDHEGWYMTALENTSHQHTRGVLTLKVHHHYGQAQTGQTGGVGAFFTWCQSTEGFAPVFEQTRESHIDAQTKYSWNHHGTKNSINHLQTEVCEAGTHQPRLRVQWC